MNRVVRPTLILLTLMLAGLPLLAQTAEEGVTTVEQPEEPSPAEIPQEVPLPDLPPNFMPVDDPVEFGTTDPRIFRVGLEVDAGVHWIAPDFTVFLDLSGALNDKTRLAGKAGFTYFLPVMQNTFSTMYIPLGLELRFPPFLSAQFLYYLPLDFNFSKVMMRAGGGVDSKVADWGNIELYLSFHLNMTMLVETSTNSINFPMGAKLGTRLNF